MIPYILVYFLSTVLSYCYSKSRDKSSTIVFLCLTFLTLFLPLALRYGIGTDYKTYVRIIQDVVTSGINDEIEIGWTPLLLIIRNFHLDSHIFFLFPAFLSTLIAFTIVPRQYLWFCLPSYTAIYWLESFSLVRQAFAASVFLVALHWFFKKKYLAFLVFALLSSLLHKSMFILLILTPLSIFNWRIFTPWTNTIILMTVYLVTRFVNLGQIIMDVIVGNTAYARYITSQFNKESEGGSGLGLYLRLVIFLILLIVPFVPYRKKYLENKNKFSSEFVEKRREYNLLCIYIFFLTLGHILAYQIHIFNRIPNIFSVFYLFFAYKLVNAKSRYRKLAMFFFQGLLFLLFLATLRGARISLGGGLGIVPYQSIFSR